MRMLSLMVVLHPVLVAAAPVPVIPFESSVTVTNRTTEYVETRVRAVGDEEWDYYPFDPEEEARFNCDECTVEGFEIEVNLGNKPNRYYLVSEERFALTFDQTSGRWVVYVAKAE